MRSYYCNICKGTFWGHESVHVSNRHPDKTDFAWSNEV